MKGYQGCCEQAEARVNARVGRHLVRRSFLDHSTARGCAIAVSTMISNSSFLSGFIA